MSHKMRWNKSTLIFGGATIWGLFLVGCVVADRTMVAPPNVAGATFVGSKKCEECHEEQTGHFEGATHSRIALKDAKGIDIGCESCHGGGSLHVKSGGAKATIVNPNQSPETCFTCHLDKRGEFSLPHAHPVLSGQVTCNDCHNPHKGHVVNRSGAELETPNETCTKCHTAQKGPFLFKHNAMVEGCTACHNPHGTVNQKMLVARDANLCLRCHLEHPAGLVVNGVPGMVGDGKIVTGSEDHRTRLQNGTCWSAGCHEDVHGSNASKAMRY
jgi:predicted CXXCH cytochrome family protein